MKRPASDAILNRRARFDYELGDEVVAGISLNGREVRAARDGHVQLKGAYVSVRGDELWLTNASFSVKPNEAGQASQRAIETGARKLLAKRRQIDTLLTARKTGLTIVPLKLLNKGRYIKLVIALGKGKRTYDKRQAIKKRDQARDIRQNLSR